LNNSGLYAIHITGPDSILAVESFNIAEHKKVELNAQFKQLPVHSFSPKLEANIVDWPYDRESHAEAVLNADWTDVL
jgi:hypothetical protein